VHEPEVGVSSPADLQPAPKAIASERDRKIAEALNLMIEEARAAGEEAADDERPLADLARIWHGCRLQTFIGSGPRSQQTYCDLDRSHAERATGIEPA
jgi:hypothetical protein